MINYTNYFLLFISYYLELLDISGSGVIIREHLHGCAERIGQSSSVKLSHRKWG